MKTFTSQVADKQPLLQLRKLSVKYGGHRTQHKVLDEVNLSVSAGEVVALVGESGSGKSTLTKTIIGLLPSSGTITGGQLLFDGQDLTNARHRDFRKLRGLRIGLVPQDPGASLDPVKTIGSQLVEVFKIHPSSGFATAQQQKTEAIRLLDLVGIDRPEQRLRQYPHELSGGLKQRILIAIAFALKPDLLIADEPTSALDVTVQRRVLEVFDRLASDSGSAVLFVTHDLALATDHAQRIIVLQHGSIVEDRHVSDVLTQPQHSYTKTLLAAAAPREPHSPSDPNVTAESVNPPAIEVQNLSKAFGTGANRRAAVDNVSFTIASGTTFSLVGESGSGKSTTARMIMQLLPQDSGTVKIAGQQVQNYRGAELAKLWRTLQLVYQNPDSALDPRMSIGRIIAEPLANHKIGTRASQQKRVTELLDQVHLPQRVFHARPAELSGGQRQRVAIARALVVGAKILVLDEALSALDVVTQAQILELLDSLQKRLGLTYLFISHDLHVVERISHQVGVMQAGKLVETGTATEIFTHPREDYTKTLIQANPGYRLRESALAV